jgi:hypothetical protein
MIARIRPRSTPPSPVIAIDRALLDSNLLGASLGDDLDSWSTWITVLRAAYGLPLSRSERMVFRSVSGGRAPPVDRVDEFWAIVGRRGGKSRTAAAIGVHAACFTKHKLAAGEIGEVAIVAATQAQANVIFQYCLGFIEASPVLAQAIESTTSTEIRLRGNIVIAVRAGSYRTVRGRTLLCAIVDEVAFLRDELSASPDVELYRALLPALATTHGLLVGISTPYRRSGLLHQKHQDHFGKNDPHVLVVRGASRQFNPTIDRNIIARATQSDPEAAKAEWDAEFRDDVSSFLDDATIDAAIDRGRPLELPPRQGVSYSAFCDVSGGRKDHFTIAVGHREGDRSVIDVVRGCAPPFDPHQVVADYAALVAKYGVIKLRGDAYAEAWAETAWRGSDLIFEKSEINKSQIYLETVPIWTRNLVSIPNHVRLLRELRLLERSPHRGGRDTVDHPKRGSDDYSNSVCGVVHVMTAKGKSSYLSDLSWVSGDEQAPSYMSHWMSRHQRPFGT